MDRFDEIETFVRIVETGSITAAANQLNIAKSAVSRRLQELENRLGVQLLQRTTRRLHLTDPGQELYQRGLRLLHDLEETEQQIISGQQALQGPLRISAPIAFGVNHLGSMINTFLAQHPDVEFDLQLDDREINMVEEGIDVTLRVGRLEDSSLIAKRIAPINFLLCASPDYLTQHGEPTCTVALADHDAIGYTLSPEGRSWPLTTPSGEQVKATPRLRMLSNNGNMILNATIAGRGISLLPTFECHAAISSGKLVPIMLDHRIIPLNLYALYLSRRHLPVRVRTFIDFIAEQLSGTPPWDRELGEYLPK